MPLLASPHGCPWTVTFGSLRCATAHVSGPRAEAAEPIIIIVSGDGTDDQRPARKSETAPPAGEETLIRRFVTRRNRRCATRAAIIVSGKRAAGTRAGRYAVVCHPPGETATPCRSPAKNKPTPSPRASCIMQRILVILNVPMPNGIKPSDLG